MSKEKEPTSGAAVGARTATGGAPEERRDGRGRWSARRKFAAVLGLLHGEDLETLWRELGASSLHIAFVRRQHNNAGVRKLAADGDDRVDATYFRHLQIHEHDIRTVRAKALDGLASVGRFGHQHHFLLRFPEPVAVMLLGFRVR